MKVKKRKQQNFVPFAVLFVVLICVGAAAAMLIYSQAQQKALSVTASSEEPSKPSEPPEDKVVVAEKKPEPKSIKFLAVGDNLIHDGLYLQAKSMAGGDGYDFSYSYQFVADRIAGADIASINQETVIYSEAPPSPYPFFNSPKEVGEEMVKIGFNVINLANNHIYDKGEKGLLSCLNFWNSQPIKYTGAYLNQEDFDEVRVVEKNGITFGFVGLTELTNGLSLSPESDTILLRLKDEELIKQKIEKTKAVSDLVVVNAHWGIEYTHEPNYIQKDMAQKMVEWGADIIIGHHPHVIQPIEYIERTDGSRGIVVYSLGNFISMQQYGPRMLGGMVEIEITKDENGEATFEAPLFTPLITHYYSGYKNGAVYLREDYTEELAQSHGCISSSPEFGLDYIDNTVKKVIGSEFLSEDYISKAA